MPMWKIAALYKFTTLSDLPAWQARIKEKCAEFGVCGTILLASEGINSTCGATPESMDQFIAWLGAHPEFTDWEIKFSTAEAKPFKRMKIRLKKEIVTLRVPEANPTCIVGQYVEPKDWNALITDPEVITIDTRNDYEYKLGTFKGAVDPNTDSFGELPKWVDEHLNPRKHKKVAMFCTGGIRCEKSTALLKSRGFDDVYHLKGGILRYLEEVPQDQSLWEGECFVFDERVTVTHGVKQGNHIMCYGCGDFIPRDTQNHPDYKAGFHCPSCKGTHSAERLRSMSDQHKHYSSLSD